MPVLKGGKRIEDSWTSLPSGDEIPAEGPLIVNLAQWREERDALCARRDPLGILLASHESPEEIADELDHFSLVCLDFPVFNDGRSHSSARLLRERYGYDGELRAVGDVLLEQLHFLHRNGFDAFDLDSEHPEEDWRIAEADMQLWYQPTGDERTTVIELRHL